jgi:glucose dehydrogenase
MTILKYVMVLIALLNNVCFAIVEDYNNWTNSNGGYNATRNSNLQNIDKSNINKLIKTWQHNSGDLNLYDTVQATPIFINNLLITVTVNGNLIALNPENGKKVWIKKLPWHSGRRGMTSIQDNIYISTSNETYEINSKNGQIIKTFEGGSSLPPIVNNGKIFIAQPIGGITAFDKETGEKIWNNALIKNEVSARIWSGFSFDIKNNTLFAVTANYTLDKNVETGYSNSIIAINADTGKIKWYSKEIKNDWKDLDMVSPPIISQGHINGIY